MTTPMQKALFLDRDGVINIDTGYVNKIEGYTFNEGIFDLCRHFQNAGYLIIVITNQSGVARGMFTEEDFEALNTHMIDCFRDEGITITRVYPCFHHVDGLPPYNIDCEDRKPGSGFFLKARDEYGIDMKSSLMIGDRKSDIKASSGAGVEHNFLIRSRYTEGIAEEGFRFVNSLAEILEIYPV